MSEGACILILEELDHALARGARIYAEIVGFGCVSDAYEIVAPREDGNGARRAMLQALAQASWRVEEIDYINAHATSTFVGDRAEANAIAGVGMSTVFQELVETRVAKRADEIEAGLSFDAVTSPLDFERWCAQVLGQNGWRTTVTKASGDQGADVLAEKDEQTVVLQCKLYTGAVGNKAVQEAFSAQRHYATRRSAVVTNAQFTKSAQELARTTKVLLLHYSYPPGECRLARSDGG